MIKFHDGTAIYKVAYSSFMLGYCAYHTKQSSFLTGLQLLPILKIYISCTGNVQWSTIHKIIHISHSQDPITEYNLHTHCYQITTIALCSFTTNHSCDTCVEKTVSLVHHPHSSSIQQTVIQQLVLVFCKQYL